MKKLIFFGCSLLILFGCTGKSQEKMETVAAQTEKIDLNIGSMPKNFSAKTFDGSTFSSKDFEGKYWVIFVFEKNYLTKSETYDMVAELNETHQKFGAKIPMVGLLNGFEDDQAGLKILVEQAKFKFKLVNNTQSPDKELAVDDNIICTPAKIIIDPSGKVLYNGCGGKTQTIDLKLDSIVREAKL